MSAVAPDKTSPWLIGIAVLLAAALRSWWALGHGLALEQEGVEYARIAENLLHGKGYVGIFSNGTQLNFPPLYPLLIAAVSSITGNAEWAARAINISFGAALVIPMFLIAGRLYGRRTAVTVAALVIFHPVLIAGGASTYSEGPYLTLMMFAVLCLMNWVNDRRRRWSAAAGALFGLAYLIRPEAFLFAGIATGCGVLASWRLKQSRDVLVGAGLLFAAFALIAAPNVAFLTNATGTLRIEAKGTLAYQWGERMNRGMTYAESANGIGQDLSDQGVFMRPNLDVITSARFSLRDYVLFVVEAARKNFRPILNTITKSPSLGSPWLFVLVALGLCGSVWNRHRAGNEAIVIVTALLFVLVLLTVQALWFRYFFCILGMLLIWAGKGADELQRWSQDSITAITGGVSLAKFSGVALKWVAIAATLLVSFSGLRYESQFAESLNWERRDAGLWLRQQKPGPSWVMDTGVQVAYYAQSNLMYLPYSPSELAVKYIAKKNPDYIILMEDGAGGLPYTAAWFRDGIPDSRATLIYDRGGGKDERIKIYRWSEAPTS